MVFIVPRTRPPYPEEFRRDALQMLRAGRSPRELAEAPGVSEQTLGDWRRQDERDTSATSPRRPGVPGFAAGRRRKSQRSPPMWATAWPPTCRRRR
jgi:transposase